MNNTIFLLTLVAAAAAKSLEWRGLKNIIPMTPSLQQTDHPFEGARIMGGEVATPHAYPYQVFLGIPITLGLALCGGSLIDSEWVLTAAHCLSEATGYVYVSLGVHNIKFHDKSSIMINGSIVKSSSVHVHPTDDIGLIKLAHKVTFNTNIQPVRLPSRSELQDTFANLNATVTGWGRYSDNNTDMSPQLRYVTVPVMTNTDCNQTWSITDAQICTSSTGDKGACSGDSGGPLVVTESDGIITQIGIVHGGSGSCKGKPDIFTRVTSFMDWISSTANITIRN